MDEERIKTLIDKRGLIKASLTRIKNAVDKFDKTTGNINLLKVRLPNLHSTFRDFDNIQGELELIDNSSKTQKEREEFEDRYYEVEAKLITHIDEFKANSEINPFNASETNNHTSSQLVSNIRLPQLNLPTFEGNYISWTAFHDTFVALIHDSKAHSNIEKYHYLRSCLKGDAFKCIESVTVSAANYDIAWLTLKKRFENTRLIIQEHVFGIINSPIIQKSGHLALRRLVDDITINLEALKSLNQSTNQWNALLIPLIAMKFDFNTKREWEATLSNKVPEISELVDFLQKKCLLLESLNASSKQQGQIKPTQTSNTNNHAQNKPHSSNYFSANIRQSCIVCKECHALYSYKQFSQLSVPDRISEVKKAQLCLNCFKANHKASDCRSSSCRVCNKKHNSLLHLESEKSTVVTHVKNDVSISSQVLLGTAEILVKSTDGSWRKCRALLDGGSQSNFITKDICDKLKLKLNPTDISVCGINNTNSNLNYNTQINFKSQYNQSEYVISCLVIPKITDNLPTMSFETDSLTIPSNLLLADTNFNISDKIDILLGAGIFWSLLREGRIPASHRHLQFKETTLGWVVGGNLPPTSYTKKTVCHLNTLQEQMRKFWEIENCAEHIVTKYSVEELACIQHFKATHKRNDEGRYIVRLPFRNIANLGNSKHMALQRFQSLERRLNRDDVLKSQYNEFMQDYITLKHMTTIEIPNECSDQLSYYLPHHAVFKESSSTTKLRVVFDASAKTTSGLSLNDALMVGPKLQEDLFAILLRFRKYQYVLTADISKMYRQILVAPDDRKYQRILWRDNKLGTIKTYELNTVTYGTACAPYLAVQCLRQLAVDENKDYLGASQVILRDFYVDDVLTGCNIFQDAFKLCNDLQAILSRGGFELRKWASNEPALLPLINHNATQHMINLQNNGITKLLGLWWNYNNDNLSYVVDISKSDLHSTKIPTKRSILSKIAQIFDPLGLVSPIIITAKLLIQTLWQLKHGWDQPLPTKIDTEWSQLLEQLTHINKFQIPRKVIQFFPAAVTQLHGFSDASERAYGACIYVRAVSNSGQVSMHLLCAKSRVAPLKTLSIPRLELCGALLLTLLMKSVSDSLNIHVHNTFYWTDSTIVLAWLASPPNTLKTFVANRVAEIQTLSDIDNWHHIRSAENPADLVSRGSTPQELVNNLLWFHGPEWLKVHKENWPINEFKIDLDTLPERRIVSCPISLPAVDWIYKFSTYIRLRRVTAYCLRFIHNCRSKSNRVSGTVSLLELDTATVVIAKIIQRLNFQKELHDLTAGREISHKSRLKSLNPFIDDMGLIRVGGRLKHSELQYNHKFPIVLPKHHVTKLIIRHTHRKQMHAGTTATLSAVRERFWPLSGRSQVRQVLHKCIPCYRVSPKSMTTMVGDLPSSRVSYSRPFVNCGVDYAGPIIVKEGNGRGKRNVKGYICVFVCFATKAMHLELVTDLTTHAFLNALKRFLSRHGMVSHIYSDNATNFVGAQRELQTLQGLFESQQFKKNVIEKLIDDNITWHFIPARSPHFGGLWEAGVNQVKNHIKRVISNSLLTFEEMHTLLACIEACLNSRPLCPLSNDPNDLMALTPGHFLIGTSMTAPQEPSLLQLQQNKLSRYQHIEQLRQHFWSRWSREYLSNLQPRTTRGPAATSALQPGTLVILRDTQVPPLAWRYGRIVDVHPGADGVIRVASIKTGSGVYKRAVRNICVVPIDNKNNGEPVEHTVSTEAGMLSTTAQQDTPPPQCNSQRNAAS